MNRSASLLLTIVLPLLLGCSGSSDTTPDAAPGPTSPSTTEPSRTPQPVPDGAIYFAADHRGGDALRGPVTPAQAELHPKPSDIYLSRRGEPVRRVVAGAGEDRCPRVSPDGDLLAYLHESTIVVAPLDASGEPGAARVRVRTPAPLVTCPEWSPRGQRLGYVAVLGQADLYTARPAEVHVVTLDGDDRRVASFGVQAWHEPVLAWSPDGREVAFTTESGVWLAPLGGTPRSLWRPAPGDPSQELPMAYDRPTSLAWSPGGSIAFTVYASEPDRPDDPYGTGSASWTAHLVDPVSGRAEQVGVLAGSDGGGGTLAWSPDGRRLAFRDRDGRLRLHDATSGATTRVPRGAGPRGHHGDVAWSPDGEQLLAVARADAAGYALVSIPIDGSRTELRTPWTWALDWIGLDDVTWGPGPEASR